MTTKSEAEAHIKLGFLIHLSVYVIVNGGLMTMNFMRHPEKPWSLWMAGGWGAGVGLHVVLAFVIPQTRERTLVRIRQRGSRDSSRRNAKSST